MSLPVACYFEQKHCCFRSMLVRGTLVKMVLSAHSLLRAQGEILIYFTRRRESIAILDMVCGKQLILVQRSSTVLAILGILKHIV